MTAFQPGPTPLAPPGPERDPDGVRRMFTSIAGRYDLANRLLSLGTDSYWRWVTARQLAPAVGDLCLDVACGTGDLAMALRRRGGEVIGLDFTLAMLQQARRRDRSGRLLLTGGDALRLPFPDETFDRLSVAFGVRNFADLATGLREFHRVLRPGGLAGILEFSRPRGPLAPLARFYLARIMPALGRFISGCDGPYNYLADSINTWPDPGRLAELLRAAGFVSVSWRSFTAGIAVLHLARRE
ncbi:MAG: class I SAM-dependent methyltransferase [Acidobacteria bacterium]|nr:class I SAM-dependent methyltransferase [Acidobacteriota bacterium]